MVYSKRKIILISIVVVLIPLAFAVFYISSSGVLTTERYTVRMRIGSVVSSKWSSVYQNGVIAVFIKNNNTVSESPVWFSPVQNITLPKGAYTIKIYEGKTGVFIKEFEIYVAKDIEIEIHV